MAFSRSFAISATFLCSTVHSQITLDPPTNSPPGASLPVDFSFPSFAIQPSSFPYYSGNASHPNLFSANLIESIQNRTGGPLVLRLGGTNGDKSLYDPHQVDEVLPPQIGAGIGQTFTFGQSYFEGLANLGTKWVFGAPFADANKTNCVSQSKAALDKIGIEKLDAFEIGNEPNLYVNQDHRDPPWGPKQYVPQWQEFAGNVSEALELPAKRLFQGIVLSNSSEGEWNVLNMLQLGDFSSLKSISMHHYEYTATSRPDMQRNLMNHTFIAHGINAFLPAIKSARSHSPPIDLVMGEVGRYPPDGVPASDVQSVFGSALWTADYLLYSMTQNVTRVNMQLGVTFDCAWGPPKSQANSQQVEVRAPYYAHIFAADFIGTSKTFRVHEIKINSGNDLISAYAGYEGGKLKRMAVINFELWQPSDGNRSSQSFNISAPGGKTVKIQKLTAAGGGTAQGNFTWKGETWSGSKNGRGFTVSNNSYKAEVMHGTALVQVEASQAAMITFSD